MTASRKKNLHLFGAEVDYLQIKSNNQRTKTLFQTHQDITVLHRSQSLGEEENVMHNKTGLLTSVKRELSQCEYLGGREWGVTGRAVRSV